MMYIGSIDEKSPFVYSSGFFLFDENLTENMFIQLDIKSMQQQEKSNNSSNRLRLEYCKNCLLFQRYITFES